MNPTIQTSTTNLPGVPVLPGRNTPFIQAERPKNVPQSATVDAASAQKDTKETKTN